MLAPLPLLVRDAVPALPPLDRALLREAEGGRPRRRDPMRWRRAPASRLVEARQPRASPPSPPERLRIGSWNLERCCDVEASAALLRRAGMDLGMARSGQRHTARDLAAAVGAGHVYGVEFVELGLGFGIEPARFAGQPNSGALRGNAVVTALPFRAPAMLRLDGGGAWFGLVWHHGRLGGRVGVGATVELARGPVLLVSFRLESGSTPAERRRPATGRAGRGGGRPRHQRDAGRLRRAGPRLVRAPEAREPLFGAMRDAGFDWLAPNAPDQTRRPIPDGRRPPRVQRIDWFLTRGLAAPNPRTWPAVDDGGAPLSDHEPITVDIG